MSETLPEYLTTEEAALYLGVTRRTITNLVNRGNLTPYRRLGCRWNHFRLVDLDAVAMPQAVTK